MWLHLALHHPLGCDGDIYHLIFQVDVWFQPEHMIPITQRQLDYHHGILPS